jgi:hypothetical protein
VAERLPGVGVRVQYVVEHLHASVMSPELPSRDEVTPGEPYIRSVLF